ncbi:MAG: glycosyltransferase, partial [Candidatus Omnitrophota bacterium]
KKGVFRKSLGLDDKTLLVGIVGRLTPIKNHRMFIEAVKLFKQGGYGIDVKFLVIGDGELKESLQNYASRLGIADMVKFCGWHNDMAEVYADLDLVALTSLSEGTPLSLIEAMAAGKAVVSTDVGGVSDLIEDQKSGLLVENGNAYQFKDAMARLLRDSDLRRRLGEAGGEFVCAAYSKDRLLKDMEGLYKALLKEKEMI